MFLAIHGRATCRVSAARNICGQNLRAVLKTGKKFFVSGIFRFWRAAQCGRASAARDGKTRSQMRPL